MNKNENTSISQDFLKNVSEVLKKAKQNAKTAVNLSMVYAYYEIESVKNDWSLTELKRQYNSSLYERIALSTDKDKVYRLALEGQLSDENGGEDDETTI